MEKEVLSMELKEKMTDVIGNVKDFVTDNQPDIVSCVWVGATMFALLSLGHTIGYCDGYINGINALLEASDKSK